MINKWDIYYCDLDPRVGSEQKGVRPVLVISTDAVNHNLPVSSVLPFSSTKPGDKIYPTEVALEASITGLPMDSIVMIQQIRTVSHSRLTNLAGTLHDALAQKKVLAACRDYFDL